MFNGNGGYSLSDIAAVSGAAGGRGGFGGFGDDGWWIILLFLFGWGGNGWGGGGSSRTRDDIAYGFDINNLENGIRGIQNGLADGFYEVNDNMHLTTSTLQNGLYGINTGIMQGVNALQMGMNTGFNGITGQLTSMAADSAACCCETQRLIERGLCELNYNILTQSNGINVNNSNNTRDIIENQNNNTRSILEFLTNDKIATLQAENQNLKLAASQQAQNAYLISELGTKAPIPAYTVPNPYASYFNNGCGCGTGFCG